jgi:hypothetical protein
MNIFTTRCILSLTNIKLFFSLSRNNHYRKHNNYSNNHDYNNINHKM